MPQDSLKSVVYRSLVSCDDPNGVAENETVRKSKKRHNLISTTTRKTATTPTRNDSYRGDDRNAPQSSSHQLLEVSRGAQNLNHMIDSWSNGSIMNGQHSDDIARDLLRGALDLQDSLIMLCKMQEASKYMSQLKNKHELQIQESDEVGTGRVDSGRFRIEKVDSGRFGIEKVDSGRFGIEKVDSGRFGVERVDSGRFGVEKVDSGRYGVERVDSGRYAERIHRGSIENSRLWAGESSKNCSDELKKVIRDSLSRQNLLPVSSNEENASLTSISDVPTTSSSHSSTVLSNDFASVDSSLSSTGTQKKAKSRSVIAKLMGLEDFPSEPAQLAPKLPDYEKDLIPRRPISDVEKPKAVNPYFVNRISDPERTLQEIIETMQFKGLLQSKSKSQSHFPKKSFSKHLLVDDEMPPIVIIKPMRFPSRETKRFSQEEGASLYYKGKSRRMEDQRFVQDLVAEEPKVVIQELEITEEKNVIEATAEDQEVVNSKTMSGGLKAKGETRARKVIREDGNLLSKQILKKPRPRTPEMASTHKTKDSSVAPASKIEKIEKSNSKVGNIEQTLPTRRKPMQKEVAKASTPARSLEHVRAVSTKVRKLENGSTVTRDRVHHQRSTTANPVLKRLVKPGPGNVTDQKKKLRTRKAKPVRDSLLDAPITNTSQCKDRANEIRQTDSLSTVSTSTSTSTDTQNSPGKDEEPEAAKVQMRDYKHEDQTVLGEVTLQIDEHSTDISSTEEAKQDFDHKKAIPLPEIDMKEFFLSSASFVNYAEDLFDLHVNQLVVLQTTSFEDVGMIKSRLYLDCAKELIEHKSHWNSQSRHPLVKTRFTNSRVTISLDGLVEEICNEMEILKSYSKDDGDSIVPVDKLHKMLEIDLKRKEMLGNGGWDLSWTSGFSVDDAEHMIGKVEKEVLSELIDEFIAELIC
ncbi:hypothetical protein C5167_043717 [Papaver somniferum]|uniref:Uncharacterized protein n=1 Tax=Papaver somniferum TaxID=3469 RepID=A0A4Y7LAC0_PAPSO|nr:uncharacterized protein LOC113319366 [Papaver somniferum]XP_026423417.1 uncharacterized protein LOC113319366 [Papaver somniferum]RZC81135.1 hypothetical protein C5167_043717 [Papaver somniferum]